MVRALAAIRDRSRYVILRSDSEYAIGALTKSWKIRANKQLIDEARALAASFERLRFEWVPGHAGVAENERCDELARAAIRLRSQRAPSQAQEQRVKALAAPRSAHGH